MDIYRVAFIGHRRIESFIQIECRLRQIVDDLLRSHEYVEFYLGRNGDFDILAASTIKRAQMAFGHQNSSLILVLPYHAKDEKYYEQFYDEVILPLEEKTHPKAAITKRNQWMIDHSNLPIACVSHNGGAQDAIYYAKKRGEPIVNLTESTAL